MARARSAERPSPALRWVTASLACGGVCREPCLRTLVTGRRDGPCGLKLSSRERPRLRACALHAGQMSRLAPLRAAGPFGAGGFLAGLPCGASQPVPPCLRTGCPGEGPAGGGGASGAVTPNRFAFGASGPVGPSPPAVWLSTTPPPTPRNVSAAGRTSKRVMTHRREVHEALKKPA